MRKAAVRQLDGHTARPHTMTAEATRTSTAHAPTFHRTRVFMGLRYPALPATRSNTQRETQASARAWGGAPARVALKRGGSFASFVGEQTWKLNEIYRQVAKQKASFGQLA